MLKSYQSYSIRLGVLCALFLCGCGDTESSNNDNGGRGGSSGNPDPNTGGTAGAMDPGVEACAAGCQRYNEQCGKQDSCTVFCKIWKDNFPADCAPEFDALYACLQTQQNWQADCSKEFALQSDAICTGADLGACQRAGGHGCKHESGFDESCTVTNDPPHYYFCSNDATPPPGCIPNLIKTTSGASVAFSYCCP